VTSRFEKKLAGLGGSVSEMFSEIGKLTMMMGQTVRRTFSGPFEWSETIKQIDYLGIKSLSIALMTLFSTGMVMALQFAVGLERFGGKEYVSIVVALSILRELGPVLTSVVVGGRVGSGITAELGSMAVTEQIDAIRALGADPIKKLVVPRTVAMLIVLPLLTVLADITGIIGGLFISTVELGLNPTSYFYDTINGVRITDLFAGLIKTYFFGFGIVQIACYNGINTFGGTEGVGSSTTKTVVQSLIFIFLADFFLTKALLFLE
jgi:phospholipid/cholesterol/gamma-HCH transport system permease protein